MLLVAGWVLAGWLGWLLLRWLGGAVRSLRERFILGPSGASYAAATVADVDASIARCCRMLQRGDLSPLRRKTLRCDIDKLLDRRTELTMRAVSVP